MDWDGCAWDGFPSGCGATRVVPKGREGAMPAPWLLTCWPNARPSFLPPTPPTTAPGSRKGRNFVYVHIQPQHQCIVAEHGGWAVDFIGRVEHIDEDLRAVLAELERRRPADVPPVRAVPDGGLAGGCAAARHITTHHTTPAPEGV